MAPPVTPGVPVVLHDLALVEEELERLWQANAAPADGERVPALMRAAMRGHWPGAWPGAGL